MKAVRITADENTTYRVEPLALPTAHRKGVVDAEGYRRQARGAMPRANFNPNQSDSVGRFRGVVHVVIMVLGTGSL